MKIWYNIFQENGEEKDIILYSSEQLAQWDSQRDGEYWISSGSFEIPENCSLLSVQTPISFLVVYWENTLDGISDVCLSSFSKKFFPSGYPELKVSNPQPIFDEESKDDPLLNKWDVFTSEEKVTSIMVDSKFTQGQIEKSLNSITEKGWVPPGPLLTLLKHSK